MLAIRRDSRTAKAEFRPGDLFEIILVQIKGGSAAWPTASDIKRLRAVRRHYRARAVVLASWRKGPEPTFFVLKPVSPVPRRAWREAKAADIFS